MEIGYEVMGHLDRSEFALVQIGSDMLKVSNGDCIYTERLKFCEVNDKLILNTVLMLGSQSQTIIGRPILTDASVHAVVEGHMLKRSTHYLGTKWHWREVTKLRITDIQGIEKPETVAAGKTEMTAAKKPEKVAVAA